MKIDVIASGSSGNCISVDDGHSTLILDAGLSYRNLARHVRFSEVSAVLVTHAHADHSRAIAELLRRGVPVYTSAGCGEKLGHRPTVTLSHGQEVRVGSWSVMPFDAVHDTPEPLGFMAHSNRTGERILYLVDSSYVKWDFPGLTHILIEVNYAEDLLSNGPYNEQLQQRVRQNHFSLDNLKTFLRTTDLSKLEEIYLLHLSDANSDEGRFVSEIQSLTGVPTYAPPAKIEMAIN